ncbi:MAG: hypothetical protein ILNGONEN_01535 [Syntrophorhabdaceae bacterium]|nr:hypothetical protein [Syntrophorhabdaceae bacterium]
MGGNIGIGIPVNIEVEKGRLACNIKPLPVAGKIIELGLLNIQGGSVYGLADLVPGESIGAVKPGDGMLVPHQFEPNGGADRILYLVWRAIKTKRQHALALAID